ncbi:cytidine deaminase [bacterium]|nr:cytidine deaminase [bacterium]
MKKDEIFEKLFKEAKRILRNSYAPYSNFHVGASLITGSGKIYSGTNVENASYGLSMCAERIAIFKAVNNGEKDIDTLLIYTETETFTPPCGACRQVMAEFNSEMKIYLVNMYGEYKEFSLTELFPWNFKL